MRLSETRIHSGRRRPPVGLRLRGGDPGRPAAIHAADDRTGRSRSRLHALLSGPAEPEAITAQLNTTRPLDPRGQVRQGADAPRPGRARHPRSQASPSRDRMYLVDFTKFSGEERLYEVDLEGGAVTLMRTSHGRGSDPDALRLRHAASPMTPDSFICPRSAPTPPPAPAWDAQQGPNVLLDGLEYTNNNWPASAPSSSTAPTTPTRPSWPARASWAAPTAVSRSPTPTCRALRDRMGEGRLLFAWA
jgi:hypothetical protein